MDVIYRLTDNHVTQLHSLYQQQWWAKGRSLEETKNCVAGSPICVGLVAGGDELIAFARVVTDFTFKAFIFDVIVREDHRKQGLGDKLLHLIKSHEKLVRVKHFELYCLPDLFDFYARHGFTNDVGAIRLMRLAADHRGRGLES